MQGEILYEDLHDIANKNQSIFLIINSFSGLLNSILSSKVLSLSRIQLKKNILKYV